MRLRACYLKVSTHMAAATTRLVYVHQPSPARMVRRLSFKPTLSTSRRNVTDFSITYCILFSCVCTR